MRASPSVELTALSAEAAAQARAAGLRAAGFASGPPRQWLLQRLMPVVTEGLVVIGKERPADPVSALMRGVLLLPAFSPRPIPP